MKNKHSSWAFNTPMTPISMAVRATIVGLGLAHGAAHAATITVNSSADDNGAGCTLREAIASANTSINQNNDCAVGSNSGTDTIVFSNNLIAPNNTITLSNGALNLEFKKVVIDATELIDGITVDANRQSRVIRSVRSQITLNKLVLRNGRETSRQGGGIAMFVGESDTAQDQTFLILNNCTVSNNTTNRDGGGIYISEDHTVVLNNTTISGNSSGDYGGGIRSISSAIEINNSTMSENRASFSGGGASLRDSQTTVTNSTISMNEITLTGGTLGLGGGIEQQNGQLTLINATVTGNTVPPDNIGGGGLHMFGGHVSISNSLFLDNQASSGGQIRVYFGIETTSNSNVFGGGDDAFDGFTPAATDTVLNVSGLGGVGQILSPLADNGGPTLTHALPEGSPAINAGNTELCLSELPNNTDQRGETRDDQCDVGAFEFIEPIAVQPSTMFVVPLPDGRAVIFEL